MCGRVGSTVSTSSVQEIALDHWGFCELGPLAFHLYNRTILLPYASLASTCNETENGKG